MSDPPAVATADEDALIFQWRGRPRRVWRLGAVLLASLLGHAATFYLLQVAYTPTGSLQPPAAQVVLIAPEEPAQRLAFEQWLKMADPALMTAPPSDGTADVLNKIGLRYVPSYAGVPPAFKSLEPAVAGNDFAMPARFRPPGPVPFTRAGGSPGERRDFAASAPLPTRLIFRGPIGPLAPSVLPPWNFAAGKGTRPMEPTVYLVGVRSGGGAPSIFRQPNAGESTTTGDAALEESARDYLAKLNFQNPPTGQPGSGMVWGWATFYWGREVYR